MSDKIQDFQQIILNLQAELRQKDENHKKILDEFEELINSHEILETQHKQMEQEFIDHQQTITNLRLENSHLKKACNEFKHTINSKESELHLKIQAYDNLKQEIYSFRHKEAIFKDSLNSYIFHAPCILCISPQIYAACMCVCKKNYRQG